MGETLQRVSIEDSPALSRAAKKSVLARARAIPADTTYGFVHPTGFLSRLDTIFEQLPDDSALMLLDIGVASTSAYHPPDGLIRQYGATAATAVDFPYLVDLARAQIIEAHVTGHPGVESQLAIFRRGCEHAKDGLQKVVDSARPRRIQRSIDALAVALDGGDIEGALASAETLSGPEQRDYTLMIKVALGHIGLGDLERADKILEESIALYRPMALPSLVMLGTIAATANATDRARGYFDEALSIAPTFPEALDGLARLARAEREDSELVAVLRRWLRVTPTSPTVDTFMDVARAMSARGDNHRAAEILLSVQALML